MARISIISIIILIILSGCTNKLEEKLEQYYRKVEIDGRYEIKGRYSISNALAKKSNCYSFTSNDKGNKIEMRYLDSNEKLKEFGTLGFAITQWEYDEDGNILKTINFKKKEK